MNNDSFDPTKYAIGGRDPLSPLKGKNQKSSMEARKQNHSESESMRYDEASVLMETLNNQDNQPEQKTGEEFKSIKRAARYVVFVRNIEWDETSGQPLSQHQLKEIHDHAAYFVEELFEGGEVDFNDLFFDGPFDDNPVYLAMFAQFESEYDQSTDDPPTAKVSLEEYQATIQQLAATLDDDKLADLFKSIDNGLMESMETPAEQSVTIGKGTQVSTEFNMKDLEQELTAIAGGDLGPKTAGVCRNVEDDDQVKKGEKRGRDSMN